MRNQNSASRISRYYSHNSNVFTYVLVLILILLVQEGRADEA